MEDLQWPTGDQRAANGFIDGPDGLLEVDVELPRESPRGFVVVAHPHPQQGGTKDNKVVYMTARAIRDAGLASLRFNFRDTGRSQGHYDGGRGEQEDLRAVRDWALQTSGLACAGLAGFSFGSAAALRVADADGAQALLTIGLPTSYFDAMVPRPDCPWLAIYADDDEIIDADAAMQSIRQLQPAVDLQIMAGAGHFLHGRLSEMRRLVTPFWQSIQV